MKRLTRSCHRVGREGLGQPVSRHRPRADKELADRLPDALVVRLPFEVRLDVNRGRPDGRVGRQPLLPGAHQRTLRTVLGSMPAALKFWIKINNGLSFIKLERF